tara:strand:+ start:293 stop:409 length:117 start_codon:yes stop_codon:yes gene_type:complete
MAQIRDFPTDNEKILSELKKKTKNETVILLNVVQKNVK